MSITSISRDWGTEPAIVRITATNTLVEITTAGYVTAQADNIDLLNNGEFQWLDTDFVAITYSNGRGFFTYDAATAAFISNPAGSGLSTTLSSGNIFVGNASNIATGVTMSGDATMANTGAMTIANDAITTAKILNANVTLAKLAAGITPSHIIKFASQVTTVGGAAAEAFTVTGAVAATDRAFVQVVNDGTANVTVLQAVVTANTLTVTFSANPGADTVINYQIIRAAA